MPQPVLDVMHEQLDREATMGGYEAAEAVEGLLDGTYASIARLLGAQESEIAFADSATRAWHMAFHAVPLGPGDRILTTSAEYSSNAMSIGQVVRAHRRRGGAPARRRAGRGRPRRARRGARPRRCRSRRGHPRAHVERLGHAGRRRSAGAAGTPACSSCSTRASRSGSCGSTWTRSAATCSPPPAASSCAGRAARASSTSAPTSWSGSDPPFLDLRAADLDRPVHLRAPPRRPPLRAVGAQRRRPPRSRRRGRPPARVGHRRDRGAGARRWPSTCGRRSTGSRARRSATGAGAQRHRDLHPRRPPGPRRSPTTCRRRR